MLERLVLSALDLPHDDPRRTDLHLVALAAHGLEQDGEVQLAAARDLELLGAELLDAQGDVGLDLAHEAVAEVAAGDVLALLAGEGGGVGAEGHADGRLVHRDDRERLRVGEVGDGLAYLRVLDAGEGHDVPRAHPLGLDALEAEVGEGLDDARLGHRAVLVDEVDELALMGLAALHAADHDAPEVV